MVAVLAAVAVALPLLASASGRPGGGSTARQVMGDALTASMGERSVHLTFTASVGSGAATAQLSGTGAADLTSKSAVLHVTGAVAGQHQAVSVEAVGGTLYVEMPQIAAVDPGKSWVSLRPGSSTGLGSSVGSLGTFADPGRILPFLRRSGAVVTPLGVSTRNGTAVRGYRVSLDSAAIARAVSGSKLPGAIAGTVRQLVLTAYVSGHLLQSLEVTETGQVPASASITFSGYGEPVHVAAPAATAVVPFSQFAGSGALPGLSNPA